MYNQSKLTDIIILEWSFSPPDYFEAAIKIEQDDYIITIEDGKIKARIKAEVYDNSPTMREDLSNMLNDHFLGAQLLKHKSYQLTPKSSMSRLHPNGKKDITVFFNPATVVVKICAPDIRLTDKDGNIIVDTKTKRIEQIKKNSELAARYRKNDPTLASLLNSYSMAVNDPNNELIHLFEIVEALSTRFGGEAIACQALNISNTKRSRLGSLANHEPLKQGRHRGKNPGSLRDATAAELSEARKIARAFIEAFMQYLDRFKTTE
jgi:hypothetical protein